MHYNQYPRRGALGGIIQRAHQYGESVLNSTDSTDDIMEKMKTVLQEPTSPSKKFANIFADYTKYEILNRRVDFGTNYMEYSAFVQANAETLAVGVVNRSLSSVISNHHGHDCDLTKKEGRLIDPECVTEVYPPEDFYLAHYQSEWRAECRGVTSLTLIKKDLSYSAFLSISSNNVTHRLYGQPAEHPALLKEIEGRVARWEPIVKRDTRSAKIIIETGDGLRLVENPLKFKEIDIPAHYNDGFQGVHDCLLDWDEDDGRLAVLYGPPGTGKTNYIKHVIQKWDEQVIYMPPNMVSCITSPGFVSFMSDHTGSIIVIEDAEQMLEDRTTAKSNSVADILNLTDGILSDFLDLKFLVTHNKDGDWLDKALLRPGRCVLNYKFEKLTPDKTRDLCQKVGADQSEESMTLAEIYNQEQLTSKVERPAAGFGS